MQDNRQCTNRYALGGYFTDLYDAKSKCTTNPNCTAIESVDCGGDFYYLCESTTESGKSCVLNSAFNRKIYIRHALAHIVKILTLT